MHHEQTPVAIERGLHVLCEKPLACEPAHVREIERQSATSGVTVTVSYQRRTYPAYLYMRAQIDAGEIGEIRTIAIVCGQDSERGTRGSWRQDPRYSGGGMLMDSGSHLVDMLL